MDLMELMGQMDLTARGLGAASEVLSLVAMEAMEATGVTREDHANNGEPSPPGGDTGPG